MSKLSIIAVTLAFVFAAVIGCGGGGGGAVFARLLLLDRLIPRLVQTNVMSPNGWASYGTTGNGVGQFNSLSDLIYLF